MKDVSIVFRRATTSRSAFTLIELLAITTAILVLMGITLGVSKGVLNQQARTRARAEPAMIAQALEEFKLMYGDYPIVAEDDPVETNANSRKLTLALTGYAYLEPGSVPGSRKMTNVNDNEVRKGFIDTEQFNFSEPFRDPDNPSKVPNSAGDLEKIYLLDPWREPYIYIYHKGSSVNSWDNVGYVLFSKGPDRKAELEPSVITTGIIDQGHYSKEYNLDNIYPNQ